MNGGNNNLPNQHSTYPEVIADSPLEVEWKTREWVGLGLMAGTIASFVSLSVLSYFVSKRRTQQRLWGAALTHEGVDDLLQVGWRYNTQQQPQQQKQQQQQQQAPPQLFLQIYDKGHGPGYNDANSMLKGGVEQQLLYQS